jgi:probable selenium-dependent hydroxylase accessory protein YqeC
MYTLARELANKGKRVVTTTTTQIFAPDSDETEQVIIEAEPSVLLDIAKAALQQYRHITIAGSVNERGKLLSVPPAVPAMLLRQRIADAVLIEADGARHHMIKAPAEHEPVILPETNVALLLMSAEAINQPLSKEIAHRPERLAAITGLHMGDPLTPEIIARVITSEKGALKGVPAGAQAYLLFTHATSQWQDGVLELARLVRQSGRITGVLYSGEIGTWIRV